MSKATGVEDIVAEIKAIEQTAWARGYFTDEESAQLLDLCKQKDIYE